MAKVDDKDKIIEAYETVRKDNEPTNWCFLKYNNEDVISYDCSGENFDDITAQLKDEERAFIYLRLQTGDEMSKRQKFAFITWSGPNVAALKRAKMSTAKAVVKQMWSSFAVEMNFDDLKEFKEEDIRKEMIRAGGANYGTGQ